MSLQQARRLAHERHDLGWQEEACKFGSGCTILPQLLGWMSMARRIGASFLTRLLFGIERANRALSNLPIEKPPMHQRASSLFHHSSPNSAAQYPSAISPHFGLPPCCHPEPLRSSGGAEKLENGTPVGLRSGTSLDFTLRVAHCFVTERVCANMSDGHYFQRPRSCGLEKPTRKPAEGD